jgi:hypothetical protein
MTADGKGKITFPNVLTGNHTLLVSYKGQNVSRSLSVSTDDVGKVITIVLPAAPVSTGVIVASAAGGVGVIGTGAAIGFLALQRRRNAGQLQKATEDPTLHEIISAPAVEAPAGNAHVPAIAAYESQPAAPSPAPWAPPPPPETPPIQPPEQEAPVQPPEPAVDPPDQPDIPE